MQLLKRLQTPSLPLRIALVAVAALLWFLPDICCAAHPCEDYRFTVLGQFVWFALPAFWARFVQFWVLLAAAVWAEALCNRRRVMNARSAMPSVCLLLVAVCSERAQFFTASTVAFLLFMYAISQLLAMYGTKRECVSEAFKLGLAVACASAFDRAYMWMAPLLLIGMVVFSTLSVRTLCTFAVGLLMPVLLLAESFALADAWPMFRQAAAIDWFAGFARLSLPAWSELGLVGTMAVMLIVAIGDYVSSNTIYNLNVRLNYIFVCLALVLTTLLAVFAGWRGTLLPPPMLCAALAMAFYFTANSGKFANGAFIAFAVCCVACRIAELFGL